SVGKGVVCLFFQAEDGIRDRNVTGVQTCALPIYQLLAPLDQLRAQSTLGVVTPAVGQVPLAGGDELQRLVAVLVELHRVGGLLRLAVEVTGGGDHLDHAPLGTEDGQTGELCEVLAAPLAGDPGGVGDDAPVTPDDGARGEL